jgi:hypothetical protein
MEIKTTFLLIVVNLFCFIYSDPIDLDFTLTKKTKEPSSESEGNSLIDGEDILEEYSLSGEHIIMNTNICLGTPKQCFTLVVDSGSFDLWIAEKSCSGSKCSTNLFDKEKSSTFSGKSDYSKQTLNYGIGSIDGYYYKDTVTLGTTELSNFQFLLVNAVREFNSVHEGILGMGYKYQNSAYSPKNNIQNSFMDQLYKQGKIKDNLFTQKFTTESKGRMFIGEMPSEISNNKTKYGTCDVDKTSNYWECKMDGVFFGDDVGSMKKMISTSVLFDTGTNFIVVPTTYLSELKNGYFKKQYSNKSCWDLYQNGIFHILCNASGKSAAEDMNFVFGDWVIKMKKEELFESLGSGTYHFIIASTSKSLEWILGTPVLKKFHMVFRKSPDQIGFWGTDVYDKNKDFDGGLKTVYIVLIVIGSLVVVGVIIGLIAFCVKKHKNRQFNHQGGYTLQQHAEKRANYYNQI